MTSLALRPANRLFYALDLPEAARRRLSALARERAARVEGRPVPEGNLHLTLRFLGRVEVEQGSRLADALAAVAGMAAPRLRLVRVQARPSTRRARLLAAVFEDVGGALAEVHARLAAAVAQALGTPPDRSSLWPHVTLVRLRRPAPAGDAVAPIGGESGELAFDVSRASLYDSETVPGGRRYVPIASAELVPPPGSAPTTT